MKSNLALGEFPISGICRNSAMDNLKTPSLEKTKLPAQSTAFSLYQNEQRKHTVKPAQTPAPGLIVRAMSSAKGAVRSGNALWAMYEVPPPFGMPICP
jgi:hypothetical protein